MKTVCCFLLIWGAMTFAQVLASAESNEAALQPGSHKVHLGDVSIHYVVAGHGPLVFVTSVGWGLGTTFYQNCFKPLESNFTLVYVDERGNGESSLPADLKEMNTSIMADDLDRLRSYLGVDNISLIGHSGGGTIALEYAERHPTHLAKGILIDLRILGDEGEKDSDGSLSLWKDDPKYKEAAINIARIPDYFKTDEEATENMLSYLNIYFSKPSIYVPIFLKLSGQHINVSAVTEDAHNKADQLANRQQAKDYNAIRAKLLIINGTVDVICPYQLVQRLHEAVPGSVLDLYANVGHFPYIEEPDRFIHEAAEFLSH
jgi:proline iminopeptidase